MQTILQLRMGHRPGLLTGQPTHTGGRLTWLITDSQNTQQLSVDAGNQIITQRRQTPYGAPRGGQPAWVNPRGFAGGDNDPTGLVHEGAREYDPTLGRFLTVDPVRDNPEPKPWSWVQGQAAAVVSAVMGAARRDNTWRASAPTPRRVAEAKLRCHSSPTKPNPGWVRDNPSR